jgi:penicillin-binding protein 2
MLIVDELKKNDPQLRLVAILLAAGLFILLVGLWWVQVVSAREYQAHLDTQAYRTIRIPAVRGKILDREGRVLAENRPRYNLSLYLDDLRKQFAEAIRDLTKQALVMQTEAIAVQEKKLGRSLTKTERRQFAFTPDYVERLHEQARDEVAAGVVAQISHNMGEEIPFDAQKFNRHYATELAMPYPIMENLDPSQIARFQENFTGGLGADLELQSMRSYPMGTMAAHLLGELRQDDSSIAGEESFFNYRLPDYRGETGIEGAFNDILHGRAGQESVLVNNMGYRQAEDVDSQPQPGENVVLTLDADLQRTAEESIVSHHGATANAAVVVMDVRNGDVLAMASSPVFDPNDFAEAHGISREKYAELQEMSAEKNRATQENYAPGSIFKVVVGLAALEDGLNPDKIYTVDPDPTRPGKAAFYLGRRRIEDTAPPGQYNFKRAVERSSNSYFIQIGLQTGDDRIVELAEKFHLGQTWNLPTRQETRGDMPTLKRIHHDWRDGDTANMCIGQGEVAVTPLQMAVVYSAIANGGTVYWPRLVSRIEPQDPSLPGVATNLPTARVRDRIGVSARSLRILHEAMLGETEDAEGTGKAARVPGLDICGKTGTAQVQDSDNRTTGYNYWFGSFAPYENPRYAVVVMVQIPGPMMTGGGGAMCAPVAHDIYEEIVKKENPGATKILATVRVK